MFRELRADKMPACCGSFSHEWIMAGPQLTPHVLFNHPLPVLGSLLAFEI